MSDYGFGPLSTNATTTRPSVATDGFGQQTWFKDATAAGAKDGTIINASWLNHIVGNLRTLCVNSGITLSNSHGSDTYVWDAVQASINSKISLATISSLGELSDVTDAGSTGQVLTKQANGTWAPETPATSITIAQGTVV